RCAATTAAVALVLSVIAGLQPAYSPLRPERLDISFVDDHIANKALWTADPAGALPKALRGALPSSAMPTRVTPLSLTDAYSAPAGATRYAAPTAAVTRTPHGAGRTVVLPWGGCEA